MHYLQVIPDEEVSLLPFMGVESHLLLENLEDFLNSDVLDFFLVLPVD